MDYLLYKIICVYFFITRTLFPVRCKSCFTLLFLSKSYHFDAILSLVYMVQSWCTQIVPTPQIFNNYLCASIVKLANATCSSSFRLFA